MTPATTPGDLLVGRLRTDPGGPLLTFYDDATGERTELSAATFANWVAKSANLLADELGVGPGDRVALRLPAHWQTVVALHAIWRVGGLAGTGELPAADVLVCDEQSLPCLPATCPVAAFSLRPLGAGLARPLPGVVDAAAEVAAQPDVCPLPPPPGDAPALVTAGGPTLSQAALVTSAPASAGRVMLVADRWDTTELLLAAAVSPLTRGSVVVCRHADPARLERRRREERAQDGP